MCRFIESIQLKNGVFRRLSHHQVRLEKAMSEFYPESKIFNLESHLKQLIFPSNGLFKCRIVYDSEIRSVEFLEYTRREIKSLKIIETQLKSFNYKSEDRNELNEAFAKRGECDDVLLVRAGLVTDSSYCNVAFFDGENWFTPRVPLIYGVNRTGLMADGKLIEKDISVKELNRFASVCLFNAMIEFGEVVLKVDSIKY